VATRIDPLIAEFGMELGQSQDATRSVSIDELASTRWVPAILSGVLALMALAMLGHTLVSAIRRRRRDLAILQTLGFTKREVSATVAWQASTLVMVSLAVGLPGGIVLGRWAWNTFAGQLGVIPVAVVPLSRVLLVAPVSLVVANLIALLPGRAATRAKPSVVLRSE